MTINGEDVSMGIPMLNLTHHAVNEWANAHIGSSVLRNEDIGACWLSTGAVFVVLSDEQAWAANPISSAMPLSGSSLFHFDNTVHSAGMIVPPNPDQPFAAAFRWQPDPGSALSTLDVFNPGRINVCGRADDAVSSAGGSALSIYGSNADGDPELAPLFDGNQSVVGAVLDLSHDGGAELLRVAASTTSDSSYSLLSTPAVVASSTPRIALSACTLTSTPDDVAMFHND